MSAVKQYPRPGRRGVGRVRMIDAAKEAVPVLELAERLCGAGMQRSGNRRVARCPLPGHDEHSASFTVYPETNSWFCFGVCQRGGDVVDLAAAAWGYGEGEQAMAAANVLHEFGHELPQRPTSWHRKEAEKFRVRDGLQNTLAESYRRRWFRVIRPILDGADEDEGREVWASLWPLARERALQRMSERGVA